MACLVGTIHKGANVNLPESAVVVAFASIFGALVAVIKYVRVLYDARSEKCEAENKQNRQTIAVLRETVTALRESIECMLDDNKSDARMLTDKVKQREEETDQYPALSPKKGRYKSRAWAVMPFVFLIVAVVAVASCGGQPIPAVGSAIEYSAGVTARAKVTADEAKVAFIAAATKDGTAKALENVAKLYPTPDNILKAINARVEAETASAVSTALARVSAEADSKVKEATENAEKERAKTEQEADNRSWVKLCRWIGLIATVGGIVLGGALAYYIEVSQGVTLGGFMVAAGQGVVFFGATITWLPLVAGGAFVLALVAWGIEHSKDINIINKLKQAISGGSSLAPVVVPVKLV